MIDYLLCPLACVPLYLFDTLPYPVSAYTYHEKINETRTSSLVVQASSVVALPAIVTESTEWEGRNDATKKRFLDLIW